MNKNKLKMAIKQNATKLLDESIGKTFSDNNCINVFLAQSPKAIEIKIKKMGPNQTYKFAQQRKA